MALKAGYYGIKKFIADKLNRMNPGDSFATDAEVAAAVAEEAQQIYKDMGILGAKNLFPSGIVWHLNNTSTFDGSTSDDNTERARTTPAFYFPYDNGEYIITGLPASATAINTVKCFGGDKSDLGSATLNGNRFIPKLGTEYIYILLNSDNFSVSDFSNLSFMIRLASDTDPTYQPYAETNLQLTQNKADVTVVATKADITALGTQEGVTASRLYHPGEHFYKDGKFCTVIGSADVAAESTWTLNTNYIEGTVADTFKNYIDLLGKFQYKSVSGNTPSLELNGVTKALIVVGQYSYNAFNGNRLLAGILSGDDYNDGVEHKNLTTFIRGNDFDTEVGFSFSFSVNGARKITLSATADHVFIGVLILG